MGTVFKMQETPTVNVAGTGDSFPVHRIYCVGQNYANQVREIGANPEREAPFFLQQTCRCSLSGRYSIAVSYGNC